MIIEVLQVEVKPLELKVSWTKIKVRSLGDLLDDTIQSVHICGSSYFFLPCGGETWTLNTGLEGHVDSFSTVMGYRLNDCAEPAITCNWIET